MNRNRKLMEPTWVSPGPMMAMEHWPSISRLLWKSAHRRRWSQRTYTRPSMAPTLGVTSKRRQHSDGPRPAHSRRCPTRRRHDTPHHTQHHTTRLTREGQQLVRVVGHARWQRLPRVGGLGAPRLVQRQRDTVLRTAIHALLAASTFGDGIGTHGRASAAGGAHAAAIQGACTGAHAQRRVIRRQRQARRQRSRGRWRGWWQCTLAACPGLHHGIVGRDVEEALEADGASLAGFAAGCVAGFFLALGLHHGDAVVRHTQTHTDTQTHAHTDNTHKSRKTSCAR